MNTAIRRPIFIVGPPRCGKKMISEALAAHSDIFAFDYEVNFLWRYGHAQYPHDILDPSMMNERIRRYIQSAFRKKLMQSGKRRVVDRTDHNVVRINYIREVFPDAVFIFAVRDPRAAIASAIERRRERRGIKPYWKKMQAVPLRDLPYYSWLYSWDIFQTRILGRGYKELWGMRTPYILKYRGPQYSLAEKCAVQWVEAMSKGIEVQAKISSSDWFSVRYEEAVSNPEEIFSKLFNFLGLSWDKRISEKIKQHVQPSSFSKWKTALSEKDLESIAPFLNSWEKYFWSTSPEGARV